MLLSLPTIPNKFDGWSHNEPVSNVRSIIFTVVNIGFDVKHVNYTLS